MPIPRSLLCHEIVLKKVVAKNSRGKETYSEIPFKRVRVDPSSQMKHDKTGADIRLQSVLFHDFRNSVPINVSLYALDDIVIFEGKQYRIASIDLLYDARKLHHLEIGLV